MHPTTRVLHQCCWDCRGERPVTAVWCLQRTREAGWLHPPTEHTSQKLSGWAWVGGKEQPSGENTVLPVPFCRRAGITKKTLLFLFEDVCHGTKDRSSPLQVVSICRTSTQQGLSCVTSSFARFCSPGALRPAEEDTGSTQHSSQTEAIAQCRPELRA